PSDGSEITFWGPSSPDNQSYGQSFTVMSGDSILNAYTLTVRTASGSTFPFVSQVYAWTGSATTGPALFTSGTLTTTATETAYTFSPNIAVTPGQQYIAFVTNQPNGMTLGGTGSGGMSGNNMNPYSGGLFYYAMGTPSGSGNSWQPFQNFDATF